jgi:radical SAM superfamily enzyme YgiQ (UPF0313 family)
MCYIADDLFTASKTRVAQIAERIREEGLHRQMRFATSASAALLDAEMCSLLKSMNVGPLFIGFESGNEQTLNYLKCGKVKVADNKRAVKLCQRHGLQCWGAVIIGCPDETSESIEDTISFVRWAREHGAYRVIIGVLVPFPGTEVWQTAKDMGRVSDDMNWDRLAWEGEEVLDGMLVSDEFKPEFRRLRDKALREASKSKWRKAWPLVKRHPLVAVKFALSQDGRPWLARLLNPLRG